MENGDFPFV